jgi:hypothetical protein
MSRDHLKVLRDGILLDATLTTYTVPGCEVGPAHKKYEYEINGRSMGFAYTKREAFDFLITQATKSGWKVFQPLN